MSLERICKWEERGREQGKLEKGGGLWGGGLKEELGPRRKRDDWKSENEGEEEKSKATTR